MDSSVENDDWSAAQLLAEILHINIGPSLVKEMEQIIIDPLAYIFNLSLSTGQVPSKLKIAKVIPDIKRVKSIFYQTTDPYHYLVFLISC